MWLQTEQLIAFRNIEKFTEIILNVLKKQFVGTPNTYYGNPYSITLGSHLNIEFLSNIKIRKEWAAKIYFVEM